MNIDDKVLVEHPTAMGVGVVKTLFVNDVTVELAGTRVTVPKSAIKRIVEAAPVQLPDDPSSQPDAASAQEDQPKENA